VDKGEVRFRVNAHFDQHGVGLSLRVLPDSIPPLKSLGFTEETYRIINQRAVGKTGLIILVGPVNSGKSTTMASFINEGNQKMIRKVLTLESPIEYIYKTFDPADPENTMNYRSLVIQREIGVDCVSFTNGLKEALRQDAQAILVGELLSEEEAHMALMAALTGHLVFCTVHATSAIDALSRIASFFPPDRRTAAVATLSRVLSCVCFQMLLPTAIVKEGATKAMKASGGILTAEDVECAHSEEQKAKAAGNSESRMASRCLAYEFLDGTPEVLRSISQWAETGDSNKMIQIESEMSIDGKGHCPFPRS
jgi:Tfp pilus assembly pilus retraction ATPase PilT